MTECDLSGLYLGDPFMVHDSQGQWRRSVVAHRGRVWLTDKRGNKFRIADGSGEERNQVGQGYYAVTVERWEVIDETERLRSILLAWGWVPSHRGKVLTLDQMRRAAALIAEFEAEQTGDQL